MDKVKKVVAVLMGLVAAVAGVLMIKKKVDSEASKNEETEKKTE